MASALLGLLGPPALPLLEVSHCVALLKLRPAQPAAPPGLATQVGKGRRHAPRICCCLALPFLPRCISNRTSIHPFRAARVACPYHTYQRGSLWPTAHGLLLPLPQYHRAVYHADSSGLYGTPRSHALAVELIGTTLYALAVRRADWLRAGRRTLRLDWL